MSSLIVVDTYVGKTSLFKIIVGEQLPSSGDILINGKKFNDLLRGNSKDIGYCPQYDCTIDYLNVEDILVLFSRIRGVTNDRIEQTVTSISKLFMLDRFLQHYADQLSGGTKRRMHAALACIAPPLIILLGKLVSFQISNHVLSLSR